VAVGLYVEESGMRLDAVGRDGQRLDEDRILLKAVEIRP
jgi:hypothetical protein